MWSQLEQAILANPAAQRPPHLWHFIQENHLACLSLYLRRVVDSDRRAVSLRNLLGRVERAEVEFSRTAFLAMSEGYDPAVREGEDRLFCRLCRSDVCDVYPAALAARHRETLHRVVRPIKRYVDQRLAHDDRTPTKVPPAARAQIDLALRAARGVVWRYYLLCNRADVEVRNIIDTTGWIRVLATPLVVRREHQGLCMPIHPDHPGPPAYWRGIERLEGKTSPRSPDAIRVPATPTAPD